MNHQLGKQKKIRTQINQMLQVVPRKAEAVKFRIKKIAIFMQPKTQNKKKKKKPKVVCSGQLMTDFSDYAQVKTKN